MNKILEGKKSGLILIGVLSLFLGQGVLDVVNPAIAGLAKAFPGQSLNNVMLLATLPAIFGIPTNLSIDFFIRVLKYKGTLFLGLFLFVVSGVAPYFFQHDFTLILITRAINGLGRGLIVPLCVTIASICYDGYARAKVLGFGSTTANIAGTLFTMVGGILAASYVHNVWFANLFMIIPLFFWLFINEPKVCKSSEEARVEEANTPKTRERIPGMSWAFVALFNLSLLFFYPYLLYVSPIMDQAGMGNAAIMGYVITASACGGIVAGLIFGNIFKILKNRLVPIACVLLVFMMVPIGLTESLVLFFVSSFIGGIGFNAIVSSSFMGMSTYAPPSRIATVIGVSSATSSAVIFVCVYVANFFSKIFGQEGNLRFPLVFGGAVFTIAAVIFFMKPLKVIIPLDITGAKTEVSK